MMYDRRTESRWPQLTVLASVGVRTGTKVVAIPVGTGLGDADAVGSR